MILQNLWFPETLDALHIRAAEKDVCLADGVLRIAAGGTVAFTTYFNSFALRKWRKYTIIDTVSLCLKAQGHFELKLIGFLGSTDGRDLAMQTFNAAEVTDCDLTVPECECSLVSFSVKALEDTVIYGGAYHTVFEEEPPKARLALAICTHKREEYVKRNMDMLSETVFRNENSSIKNRVRVYISDNGRTLKKEDIENKYVKVFPNINSGGSGGFTRCMIEALADKDAYGLTHIVLMDDDIVFSQHALELTYAFFRLLKQECRNTAIGGAMFFMDKPHIQHTAGEKIHAFGITQYKSGYDLRELPFVVLNETEEPMNYCAWWYCAFPLDHSLRNNLSLPFFFQYDDTDWGLRNSGLEKIVVSGICVRHESFDQKYVEWKDYFLMRNRLIVIALHGKTAFGGGTLPYFLLVIFVKTMKRILAGRIRGAELSLRGVDDFLKGINWLGTSDPEALLAEVRNAAVEPAKKSPFAGFSLTARLFKTLLRFTCSYKRIVKQYREQYPVYITEDFWRTYLRLSKA